MKNGITLLGGIEIPEMLVFGPIAQMVSRGRWVFVIDGENSFRSYTVARHARRLGLDPHRVLEHVLVARAFTCYQMTELITRKTDVLGTRLPGALVCLGLLGTFYDQDIHRREAQRLLQRVIARLKCLAQTCPILITLRPPAERVRDRIDLAQMLLAQADVVHLFSDGIVANTRPVQQSLLMGRSNGTHE